VSTVVSYLKVSLMLLQNYGELTTDTMGLLNDICVSQIVQIFGEFMRIVYVNHKGKTDIIECITCLDFAELEYRTLYCSQKHSKSKSVPASGFYVNDAEGSGKLDSRRSSQGGWGGRRYKGRGREDGQHIICHNCGKKSNVFRNYWALGGGAEEEKEEALEFPDIDDKGLRCPPRRNEPRTRTLPGDRAVTWCSDCAGWGYYHRAEHLAVQSNVAEELEGNVVEVQVVDGAGHVAIEEVVNAAISGDATGIFARLRAADLL